MDDALARAPPCCCSMAWTRCASWASGGWWWSGCSTSSPCRGPRGNRFLLTSRIVGYKEVRPVAEGLAECTLVDFDLAEIEQFVEQMDGGDRAGGAGRYGGGGEEAARERRELLEAVNRNPGVRRLGRQSPAADHPGLDEAPGRGPAGAHGWNSIRNTWRRCSSTGTWPAAWAARSGTRSGRGGDDAGAGAAGPVDAPTPAPAWAWSGRRTCSASCRSIYQDAERCAEPDKAARQFSARMCATTPGCWWSAAPACTASSTSPFRNTWRRWPSPCRGRDTSPPSWSCWPRIVGEETWHEVSLLTIAYVGIIQQRDQAASEVLQHLMAQAPGSGRRSGGLRRGGAGRRLARRRDL